MPNNSQYSLFLKPRKLNFSFSVGTIKGGFMKKWKEMKYVKLLSLYFCLCAKGGNLNDD